MKEGWKCKKLGELAISMADGPFGSNLKKEHYTNRKEVRIIQLSNIGEEGWRDENTKYTTYEHLETIKRSEVVSGDIVIAKMMPAGRAILCPDKESKYVLSSDAVRVTLKESLSNRFILYSINSPSFRKQVYENVSGSGRVRTSLRKLRDCKIFVPSLSEQQAIVSRLDAAFAKIEAVKANAEKQLNDAKALFKKELSKAMTPKDGWEEKKLKTISTYSIGLTYKPTDVNNHGTIVLRSSNIQNEKLDLSDIIRVDCQIKEVLYVKEDDILMCSRNGSSRLVGKVALIPATAERMTYGAFMMIIRSEYNPYLFYFFKTDGFRNQIKHGESTMINQITRYMLDDVSVWIPPLSEQQVIVTHLDTLSEKLKTVEEKQKAVMAECDAMKQALLREVFA